MLTDSFLPQGKVSGNPGAVQRQMFPAVMEPVFRETGYKGSRRSCGWNSSHAQKMLNVSAHLRGARSDEFWASRAKAA